MTTGLICVAGLCALTTARALGPGGKRNRLPQRLTFLVAFAGALAAIWLGQGSWAGAELLPASCGALVCAAGYQLVRMLAIRRYRTEYRPSAGPNLKRY